MKYQTDLVGMIRVRNGQPFIKYILAQMQKVKQLSTIVVFDDHSDDGTTEECKKYSKVHLVPSPFSKEDYNEARDREFIMQEAKKFNPRWIWTMDADEVFEEPKVFEMIDSLIHPSSPQTLCYAFPLFNLWNSPRQYNAHGLFGVFTQCRFFKNMENQHIQTSNDGSNLSSCTPWFSPFNTRMMLLRIRHFGTMDPGTRQKKRDFYSNLYKTKGVSPLALGHWEPFYKDLYGKEKLDPEDYARHINDPLCEELHTWLPQVKISLNVVTKNNEKDLPQMVSNVRAIVDEVVVCDTGSTDGTLDYAKSIDANIVQTEWTHSFSDPRNLALEASTGTHVLRMDPDEAFNSEEILRIWWLANAGDIDAYIFKALNYLDDPSKVKDPRKFPSQSIRLYQRAPGVRYVGHVHEEITKTLNKTKPNVRYAFAPYWLTHFGYVNSEEYLNRKYDYYCKLSLKDIEEDPSDPAPYHSVGVHMKHIKNYPEAKRYFNLSLERQKDHFLSQAALAEMAIEEGYYDTAIEYYRQAWTTSNPLATEEMRAMYHKSMYETEVKKAMEPIRAKIEAEKKERENGAVPKEIS